MVALAHAFAANPLTKQPMVALRRVVCDGTSLGRSFSSTLSQSIITICASQPPARAFPWEWISFQDSERLRPVSPQIGTPLTVPPQLRLSMNGDTQRAIANQLLPDQCIT